MRGREGDVAKERLVAIGFDEFDRMVDAEVDDIALFTDALTVVFSGGSKYSPQCPEVCP